MKRTISVMLGKGSVSHNSRMFHAANTAPERSHLNRSYINDDIRNVYHELFDDAVMRYNEKQTRSDRTISDYYEKIHSGKQEKPFHEIILQIGNREDMNATSENGELAEKILNEYMRSFQARNPNMRVFSAHSHMDEATPHLHIDFVPFITGSKRGLDTRVSLKQALAIQGFNGGSRQDTEWNQWVSSEKKQLAAIMERHGIEWEQKGTHEKHLSVLDYKKEQRSKEVVTLEGAILEKRDEILFLAEKKVSAKNELDDFLSQVEKTQDKLRTVKETERFIAQNARHYDDNPEYELPEPKSLMSAKTYHDKIAFPLVRKLKDVIRRILLQYFEKTKELKSTLERANNQIWNLSDRIKRLEPENERLLGIAKDYKHIRKALGAEQVDGILSQVRIAEEQERKHKIRYRNSYER